MKTVLTTIPLEERYKELLNKAADNLQFVYSSRTGLTEEQVQQANIIIGNVPPAWIKESKNLEFLQLDSAGTDGYLDDGVLPKGAKLTNATGAYGLAISEHMIASIFMLLKKLNKYQDNMKAHKWQDEGHVQSIYGKTTLVLGLGDIGGTFAEKMHALGSTVIGIRRNKAEKPEYLEELHQMKELDTLLGRADIVACSLPGTPQTKGLLNAERIAEMKDGAILVNVGRGSLIPTEALCAALHSGKLGGACLDVTEVEPLPADSPLWDAPNLILTPHVSGVYHLPETLERIIRLSASNLEAFCKEEPLKNEIDFETGYRRFIG